MKFSINIPYGLKDWKIFFNIFYPEYFYGVELPADYLNEFDLYQSLKINNQKIVNVVEVTEQSLLKNAALQETAVKNEIFEYVNSLFSKKYNFSIEGYMLDLGFAPHNKDKREDVLRINFLKKYIYALYTAKRVVSIPVNVNSDFVFDKYSEYYFKIIQKSMFHLFKLCLNIFPHDLKSSILPKDIYDKFIFDVENIRIVYEPDTGNYLTEKLFSFWLKPLAQYNYSGNIIIVPKTQNETIYENEIKKISTIIEKLSPKLL